MRKARTLALLLAALAAWSAGAEEGGGARLTAKVSAGFRGWFRRGCPVPFRVMLANRGPALRGELDLVVEGITWRRPVAVVAGTSTTVEVLAAVQSASARVSVRVRNDDGQVLLDEVVSPGLREVPADRVLAVVVDGERTLAAKLRARGLEVAALGVDDLPRAAAVYLNVDVLAVAGSGPVPHVEARMAAASWVRQGGVAVLELAADGVVSEDSLLVELGGCPGERSCAEWLRLAKGRSDAERVGDGLTWRSGLGRVAVGGASDAYLAGAVALAEAAAARRRGSGNAAVAPELYEAFGAPPWSRAVRWRVAGATLAMLAAAVAVALIAPRGWGRWGRAVCVVWVAAVLAIAARWVAVPGGPAVLDMLTIVEGRDRNQQGSATTLACLTGAARGRVTVDFHATANIVPIYYEADDVGTWRDAVVAWDSGGGCTVSCDVRRGVQRCFATWWGSLWAPKVPDDARGAGVLVRRQRFAVGDQWQSLRRLRQWDDLERGVVRWQARRWAGGGDFQAYWGRLPWRHVLRGRLLETRRHPALMWVEAREEPAAGRPEPSGK